MFPPQTPEQKAASERIMQLLVEATKKYDALSVIDRAIHDLEQCCSFVRGQMMDTNSDMVNKILGERPEFIILSAYKQLRSQVRLFLSSATFEKDEITKTLRELVK
jgi:hypothetical protein